MKETAEFLKTPECKNFYLSQDKKLEKNVIKRCVLIPFADHIIGKNESPNISKFVGSSLQDKVFSDMATILLSVLPQVGRDLKSTLLKSPLKRFIQLIENTDNIQGSLQN